MSNQIRKDLVAAYDLISQPGKWTQGTLARNRKFHPVGVKSESAVCFCAVGAIERVSKRPYETTMMLSRAALNLGHLSAAFMNDIARNVEELKPLFDEAIELAGESE